MPTSKTAPATKTTEGEGSNAEAVGFLTLPEGQQIIEEYTVEGHQLFFPEALSEEPNFQQYVPDG